MAKAKRALALPVARARVSLALMTAALVGFAASWLFGADAEAIREAALARAASVQRERPYLDAPLGVRLAALGGEGAPLGSTPPDAATLEREQAELDALLAELAAAEAATWPARFGVRRGEGGLERFALHPWLHASFLHLLWNLALLASAGAQLELRLGRACYGALLGAGICSGAALQLVAGSPGGAPLVGMSALTASLVGALALRPGGAPRDPLARRSPRGVRSPVRIAAGLAASACAIAALLGLSAPAFAPLALLGGFAAGAGVMLGLSKVGGVHDAEATLASEVGQALALLDAGAEHAPAAVELLRKRLAAADDPLAARALALALRGRADAAEALSHALVDAVRAGRRDTALAAWRELARLEAAPRPPRAELRTLSSWLRAAGAFGEARAAALAALEGASPDEAAQLAREARRADPVLAQRAAERALAAESLGAAERRALEELLGQARQDARAAGVVALSAQAEASFESQRDGAGSPRPALPGAAASRAPLEASELAPRLEEADEAHPPTSEEQPANAADDANASFFERNALELTEADPAQLELPDPETAGEAALVDALHRALGADGGELGLDEASDPAVASGAEALGEAVDLSEAEAPLPASRKVPTLPGLGPSALSTPAAPAPRAEDFAFGASEDVLTDDAPASAPPLRPLQVSAAKPLRLATEAIVLEIPGRGRAKLGYDRIDAVAAAGVKGLSTSGRAVLLIDLAIGFADGEGPLRIVRLRADGFDPRQLVAGHSSPLAALRALVAELLARTRATALPRGAPGNAPFRIYADLASYEREAFGAERK